MKFPYDKSNKIVDPTHTHIYLDKRLTFTTHKRKDTGCIDCDGIEMTFLVLKLTE